MNLRRKSILFSLSTATYTKIGVEKTCCRPPNYDVNIQIDSPTGLTGPDPISVQRSDFDIPPMPDELDRHDYPDVPFWQRSEWATKEKESVSEVKKFDFLTDEFGEVVSSG